MNLLSRVSENSPLRKILDIGRLSYQNLRLFAKRSPVRFQLSPHSGIFEAIDIQTGKLWYFSSLSRASWMYLRGFEQVAHYMSTSYAVDGLKFSNGDLVVDCGANYGDLTLWLETLPCSTRYLGLEPGRREFCCLSLNVSNRTNITVRELALGDEDGQVTLYEEMETVSSSVLPVPNSTGTYPVRIAKLDSLMEEMELDSTPIRLLKLEAEGTEPEVCRGMVRTLPRIDYIAADLGFERGLKQEATAPDVVNFLLNHGFSLVRLGNMQSVRMLFARNDVARREGWLVEDLDS